MKKIIKLKEGDVIPEAAKLLHTETVSEPDGYHHWSHEGLFITKDYRRMKFKSVVYFYYEVQP